MLLVVIINNPLDDDSLIHILRLDGLLCCAEDGPKK